MGAFAKKSLKWLSAIFFICFVTSLYAQSSNIQAASRKTAVRYLKLAEQYASSKNWQAADSNAELGLAYDADISDLWYIRAVSKMNTGTKKCLVIPFVVEALTKEQWVDYNRESARVLYADLLCSTREFSKAIEILDSTPFIYSADAEYIRAKSYYSLKDTESVEKARNRLDAARRIYPDDPRFADLFFRYEYSFGGRTEENSKMADAFINLISSYKKPSVELEIYASLFAQGERRSRMLKSFNARSLKSPLYAAAAVSEGLMKEDKALDYFYSFADKSIDWNIVKDFAASLKDEDCIREFGEYLNQYNGTIFMDTDGDLTYNLKIDYNRGRPQKITYDVNQDDLEEWVCDCDFGVPYYLHLTNNDISVEYGSWPAISKVSYGNKLTENLVAEMLLWTPFIITSSDFIKDKLSILFYIPQIKNDAAEINVEQLMMAASNYIVPSQERAGGYIQVSMLDGEPQMARYYSGEKMYAQTQFKKGLPDFRTVDMDGDGLFETTETYGFKKDGGKVHSEADEYQIITNLFGEGSNDLGIYIKMIQVDQNGDTIPDFTEEYTEGEGKITSWDSDNDGQWEIRYIKYPLESDGALIEEALFHQPLSNEIITVRTKNGMPVRVTEGTQVTTVTKDLNYHIWWIGQIPEKNEAEKLIKKVNLNTVQGVSALVEGEKCRMTGVRIGQYIFGKVLPPEEIVLEKVENE